MLLDNTEKVKQAKKWLHAGKTPSKTEEITVATDPAETDVAESAVDIDQKTI